MKFISTVSLLFMLFSCGIFNAIFELPERYVERDVKPEEMVGTWAITSESETDVDNFVTKFPDWGASVPWKTFTLNNDGSCELELEIDWLSKSYSKDIISKSMTSCSWNLAAEENLSNKTSPILKLKLEYPNNLYMLYSLYIFEENSELIVWDFIGDPDDFHPQDFVIVK